MARKMQFGHALSIVILGLSISACAGSRGTESTGEYIDDSVITTKVKAALVRDEQVSGSAINVETFKGTVQLSGFAKSPAERERAVEVARMIDGVKSIKNDIRLK